MARSRKTPAELKASLIKAANALQAAKAKAAALDKETQAKVAEADLKTRVFRLIPVHGAPSDLDRRRVNQAQIGNYAAAIKAHAITEEAKAVRAQDIRSELERLIDARVVAARAGAAMPPPATPLGNSLNNFLNALENDPNLSFNKAHPNLEGLTQHRKKIADVLARAIHRAASAPQAHQEDIQASILSGARSPFEKLQNELKTLVDAAPSTELKLDEVRRDKFKQSLEEVKTAARHLRSQASDWKDPAANQNLGAHISDVIDRVAKTQDELKKITTLSAHAQAARTALEGDAKRAASSLLTHTKIAAAETYAVARAEGLSTKIASLAAAAVAKCMGEVKGDYSPTQLAIIGEAAAKAAALVNRKGDSETKNSTREKAAFVAAENVVVKLLTYPLADLSNPDRIFAATNDAGELPSIATIFDANADKPDWFTEEKPGDSGGRATGVLNILNTPPTKEATAAELKAINDKLEADYLSQLEILSENFTKELEEQTVDLEKQVGTKALLQNYGPRTFTRVGIDEDAHTTVLSDSNIEKDIFDVGVVKNKETGAEYRIQADNSGHKSISFNFSGWRDKTNIKIAQNALIIHQETISTKTLTINKISSIKDANFIIKAAQDEKGNLIFRKKIELSRNGNPSVDAQLMNESAAGYNKLKQAIDRHNTLVQQLLDREAITNNVQIPSDITARVENKATEEKAAKAAIRNVILEANTHAESAARSKTESDAATLTAVARPPILTQSKLATLSQVLQAQKLQVANAESKAKAEHKKAEEAADEAKNPDAFIALSKAQTARNAAKTAASEAKGIYNDIIEVLIKTADMKIESKDTLIQRAQELAANAKDLEEAYPDELVRHLRTQAIAATFAADEGHTQYKHALAQFQTPPLPSNFPEAKRAYNNAQTELDRYNKAIASATLANQIAIEYRKIIDAETAARDLADEAYTLQQDAQLILDAPPAHVRALELKAADIVIAEARKCEEHLEKLQRVKAEAGEDCIAKEVKGMNASAAQANEIKATMDTALTQAQKARDILAAFKKLHNLENKSAQAKSNVFDIGREAKAIITNAERDAKEIPEVKGQIDIIQTLQGKLEEQIQKIDAATRSAADPLEAKTIADINIDRASSLGTEALSKVEAATTEIARLKSEILTAKDNIEVMKSKAEARKIKIQVDELGTEIKELLNNTNINLEKIKDILSEASAEGLNVSAIRTRATQLAPDTNEYTTQIRRATELANEAVDAKLTTDIQSKSNAALKIAEDLMPSARSSAEQVNKLLDEVTRKLAAHRLAKVAEAAEAKASSAETHASTAQRHAATARSEAHGKPSPEADQAERIAEGAQEIAKTAKTQAQHAKAIANSAAIPDEKQLEAAKLAKGIATDAEEKAKAESEQARALIEPAKKRFQIHNAAKEIQRQAEEAKELAGRAEANATKAAEIAEGRPELATVEHANTAKTQADIVADAAREADQATSSPKIDEAEEGILKAIKKANAAMEALKEACAKAAEGPSKEEENKRNREEAKKAAELAEKVAEEKTAELARKVAEEKVRKDDMAKIQSDKKEFDDLFDPQIIGQKSRTEIVSLDKLGKNSTNATSATPTAMPGMSSPAAISSAGAGAGITTTPSTVDAPSSGVTPGAGTAPTEAAVGTGNAEAAALEEDKPTFGRSRSRSR